MISLYKLLLELDFFDVQTEAHIASTLIMFHNISFGKLIECQNNLNIVSDSKGPVTFCGESSRGTY